MASLTLTCAACQREPLGELASVSPASAIVTPEPARSPVAVGDPH
jgi:hypothetical protein